LDWFVTKQRGIYIVTNGLGCNRSAGGNLQAHLSNAKYIINNAFAFDTTHITQKKLANK
jgi:hypothetical protein